MPERATLGWIDYVVIALMLAISIGIGIYYRLTGGRQRTTEVIDSLNLLPSRAFHFEDGVLLRGGEIYSWLAILSKLQQGGNVFHIIV